MRKQKPLPKNAVPDADASGAAKRKTAGALRKQQHLPSKPSADESPGPTPQAAAVKRQGRRPRPASKHDKTNRVAHKKLKLAYLARVQRTLETANKVQRPVTACSRLTRPRGTVMVPCPNACRDTGSWCAHSCVADTLAAAVDVCVMPRITYSLGPGHTLIVCACECE